jgi:hypothetical protein
VRIIYCCDPIKPARVDEAFAAEENAARATGFERSLVDYEALVAGDAAAAVRRVVAGEDLAMYRGWMLPPVRYAALHDALAGRGIRLINDPGQYQYAHFFPESYPDLVGFTPESICIPIDELDWTQLAGRLALPDGPMAPGASSRLATDRSRRSPKTRTPRSSIERSD